jgi:UDP-N-acetylbacillosamine transaminase
MTFSSTAARDAVIERLDEADIESRPLWKPMHLQPVFAECSSFVDGTSDDLFRRGLCVPSGSVLTDDQVERVAALIRAVVLASSLAP